MNLNALDKKFLEIGNSMESGVDFKLDFQPNNIKKNFILRKKFLFAAVIFTFFLSTVAYATSPYGKAFFAKLGIGIFIAENQGNVDMNLGQATDKDITVKINAAIAGKDKIILQLSFDGVLDKSYNQIIDEQVDLKLLDEMGNSYYANNGYTIINTSMYKDNEGKFVENYEINSNINKSQKMRLDISKVAGIDGNWIVDFNITYRSYHEYMVNKSFDIDGGKVIIEKVVIDAFSTSIWFRDKQINSNDYSIRFSSNKEYKEYNNYSGNITEGCEQYPPSATDGNVIFKWTMRPVQPNSIITLKMKKIGDGSLKYKTFTFELNENNIVNNAVKLPIIQ